MREDDGPTTGPLDHDKHNHGDVPDAHDPNRRPVTATAPLPAATAASAFFQRFPPEIRRCILCWAFGEKVIHLGKIPFPKLGSRSAPEYPNGRESYHRCAGVICITRVQNRAFPRDPCLCRTPASTMNGSCIFVCPLGWLLTCRQAYIEGIDVLYGTNRFDIFGPLNLQHLSLALAPPHLARIAAVELSLTFDLPNFPKLSQLLSLCGLLPETLPNLRALYINLYIYPQSMVFTEDQHKTLSGKVLRRLDGIVAELPRLTDCRVLVHLPWIPLRGGVELHENVPSWRALPSEILSHSDDGAVQGIRGYWIYADIDHFTDRYGSNLLTIQEGGGCLSQAS